MRIIEQTANRLVLHDRPFGVWFTGSLFTLAGLFIMSLGQLATLHCDRLLSAPEGCRLTEKSLFNSSSRVIALDSLRAASVDQYRSRHDGKTSITYQVVIETQSEQIWFGSRSSSHSDKERIASQINTFLSNSAQPTVTVQYDDRWVTFLFGSLFSGVGIFTIVSASITQCVFDRSQDTLVIQHRSLLGTTVTQHALRDVVDADLQERISRKKGRTTYTYRIVLQFTSSEFTDFERLPLTRTYTGDRGNQARIVSQILNFLPSRQTYQSNSSDPDRHSFTSSDQHHHPGSVFAQEDDFVTSGTVPNPSALKGQAAIAHWQSVVESNPGNADAHYRLGMALYREHQNSAASESLKTAQTLYEAEGNSRRVMEIQETLWDLQI